MAAVEAVKLKLVQAQNKADSTLAKVKCAEKYRDSKCSPKSVVAATAPGPSEAPPVKGDLEESESETVKTTKRRKYTLTR